MSLRSTPTLRGGPPRPAGAVVNWIGDSIAPSAQPSSGVGGGGVNLAPADFLAWAHLYSSGRLGYGKAAGIGGQRADQMTPRIEADALSHGGQFCGINTGTNDASAGVTPTAYAAQLRAMCAAILRRGQTPILDAGVPNPNAGSPNQRLLMDQYRRLKHTLALANGWPFVDWYSLLVDPATGGYLSAYDSGDGIHPSNAGKQVMGQALAAALDALLIPQAPVLPGHNGSGQSANLLANPIMLTDANTDGTPDSWTRSGGTVTSTLVSGDAAVKGNAWRLSDTASGGFTQWSQTLTAVAGHRLAISGLVKVVGTTGATFSVGTAGASANLDVRPVNNWTSPTGGWRQFHIEALVPADATSTTAKVYTNGGGALDTSFAQLGVYDLTAAGA